MRRERQDWVLWAMVALLLVAFAVWEFAPAQEFDWKYDEGLDVTKASLLLKGHSLYRDMWVDHPPLFTIALAAAFKVFGEEVLVARLLVLASALVSLVSLAVIAHLILANRFAMIPVLFIILLSHFQGLARLVLIGLPAIALGLASLASATAFHVRRRRAWLILAGVLYACSLLVKPITVPLFPALCALVWLGPRSEAGHRAAWRDLLLLSAIILALLLLTLIYGGREFVGQVVGSLLKTREAHGFSWMTNARLIAEYLHNDKWGLSHLGIVGLVGVGLVSLALVRNWRWLTILSLWLGGVLLALLWQTPLRSHELFLLMPVLGVNAAVGANAAVATLRRWRGAPYASKAVALIGCVAALYALAWTPAAMRANVTQRATSMGLRQKTASRQAAVQFLADLQPSTGTIITDDPMLTFLARRDVLPALVVSSYRRIEAGELAPEEFIQLTAQAPPAAIVLWRGGFDRVQGYRQWVAANYSLQHAYEDEQQIYVPRPALAGDFAQPGRAEVGLTFLGSSVERLAVEAGQDLELVLYWQAEQTVPEDYTLFVHLLDESGQRLSGSDIQPLDGEYKTSDWLPGQMIAQEIVLPVPTMAAPGPKMLAMGMYDAQKRRLPLLDGTGKRLEDGQIILTPKPVVHWEGHYDLPTMQHAYNARLGEVAQLLGYDAPQSVATSARKFGVVFYWKCLQPMNTSYTVFVHVLDENNKVVAQQDQQPGAGQFPTTGWLNDEVITDSCIVNLPEGLAAGTYHLMLGMYDWRTGARLPVTDEEQHTASDHVTLAGFLQVTP